MTQRRDLSAEAEELFRALPSDGSTVSNRTLRDSLDLDPEAYETGKRELIVRQLAIPGRGQYGTLRRREASEDEPTEAPGEGVREERELYEPFASWLRGEGSPEGTSYYSVAVSGDWRGAGALGGQWSQPDVISVSVTRPDLLPDVVVEVSTYEVKRAVDATNLLSVYETLAHGRWSHRSSLVVESVGEPHVSGTVLAELERLGLGLYAMLSTDDDQYEIREVLSSLHRTPDSGNLDEALEVFFGRLANDEVRTYRAQIGR